MQWIRQTFAVLALNMRTIPQRLSSSGVAIVGIAGVVVVFVSVLSIAAGFAAAMQSSGSPDRALVMRSGADSEMTSGLSGEDVDVIKQAPGIRRDGQAPLAAAELIVIIDLPKIASPDAPANVPVRGSVREHSAPKRVLDCRRADVQVRHQRSRSPAGPRRGSSSTSTSATRSSRARTGGTSSASLSPTAASPKPRSGSTPARSRAPIAEATPISPCWRGSSRATRMTRFATGSRRIRS